MTLRTHRPAAGFTLVELLIVIVLIAVVMAVAVAGIGNRDGDAVLEEEAHRLAALIELARERAESSAQEWGLDVAETGYAFLVYDQRARRWELAEDERFRERSLPDVLNLGVEVDARDALGGRASRGRRDSRTAERVPDILLLSSGESSQFELRIGRREMPQRSWSLQTDGLAMVRVVAPESGR